jgi:hypothetical protein
MKNKDFKLGILVMVLVFGMAVPEFVNAQTDARLNGTWKNDDYGFIEKFDSGNYEDSNEDGTPIMQGIYSTRGNKITFTNTYFFGTELDLDARWYSKEELGRKWSHLFEAVTMEFFINGNKLTYVHEDGEIYTFTLVSRDGKFTQASNK